MYKSSTRRESRSVWEIDDFADKENDDKNGTNSVETHDQQQQQQSQTAKQQPQKIASRRQSQRILQKRLANANDKDKEDKNTQIESNEPPSKKRRENQPMAKESVQPASSSASVLYVDDLIAMKTKSELSKAIFGLFEDFQQDEKYANRYSAKCTVCDEKENTRISFLKGINSNLKSHLERVSKSYFCFRFC